MSSRTTRLLTLALLLASGCASARGDLTFDGARIWHVKAIRPDGSFVDVKALEPGGRILDVKALETPGNLHLMDVKALRDGEKLDVKLLPGGAGQSPMRAIGPDGSILEIAALPPEGGRLLVAGVRRDGNVFHVKAVEKDGSILPVKAISPEGHLMDVKGIAFGAGAVEAEVHGVGIAAHVKAIPQETGSSAEAHRWRVRAIHPDGRTLAVRAVGADGVAYDLAALETPGNRHVMDVKAMRGGEPIAVKIVADEREGSPVRAITREGSVLEVRAVAPDGAMLPVRAVRRSGNVFHVKAVGPDGLQLGVKALSPEGFLHDVKGLKLTESDVEGAEAGVPFRAHVKALPQVLGSDH